MKRPLPLACVLLVCATIAHADVIELKTGQRVEGTLKQATPASVSVEVGGQTITFEGDKVRAIYFGTAPAAVPTSVPSSSAAAIQALKALRSATSAGLTYRDYGPRVADAKIEVDRHLSTGPVEESAATVIREAMGLYTFAGRAWAIKVASPGQWGDYQGVANEPLVEQCPPLKEAVAKAVRLRPSLGDELGRALVMSDRVPEIWSCAADKIVEAEKLLLEKSK